MTLAQRLTREPVLIIGLLTALFGVLTVFGVNLSKDQIGAVVILAGAIMALVRFIVTPASEVAAQLVPGKQGAQAGPAASVPDGTQVGVVTKTGEQVA